MNQSRLNKMWKEKDQPKLLQSQVNKNCLIYQDTAFKITELSLNVAYKNGVAAILNGCCHES